MASILVGEGDAFEVHLLSAKGRIQRIIRARHVPVPLTPSDILQYKAEHEGDLEGQARFGAAKEMESITFPQHLPPYRRVEADERGRIWVELYRRPSDSVETWILFDQEGTLLGRVLLPRDSRVLWFGSNEVILRRVDEDGFINISVHRFRGP
jgi:hypothetical protein